MARLRIGGITTSTPPRLRIGGITADGAAPVGSGRLRIGGITADGARAVVLAPFTNRVDVEPLTTVTVTATLAAGSDVPDSYVWRVVPPGASVGILGTGQTITFAAPAALNGAFTIIGVRAVKGSQTSLEQTIRIDTLPHGVWFATSTGFVARPAPFFA